MAFSEITTISATAIKDISIQIFDPDPLGSENQAIEYSVQIEFSDGSIQIKKGDLQPHLTGTQITTLVSFMASLRTQAGNEFLP